MAGAPSRTQILRLYRDYMSTAQSFVSTGVSKCMEIRVVQSWKVLRVAVGRSWAIGFERCSIYGWDLVPARCPVKSGCVGLQRAVEPGCMRSRS